jgi:hypothetical protein
MAGTEPIDFDGILSSMYRLGPTDEERRRAASSAMLKMGLGILAANQPSPTPRNTLGVIAAGALPAVDAYQSSVDKQIGDRKSAAMAGLATTKLMGDLRAQKRHDEAFGDIGNMTPDQRKDPKFLYDQALRHSAGGNDKLAGTFLSMANHLDTQANRRDPSQMERALDVIRTYHLKDSMAPGTLTPEEQANLHNAVAIVGQVRTAIDPVTQRMETIQPLTLRRSTVRRSTATASRTRSRATCFRTRPAMAASRSTRSEKELQGFNDASTQLFSLGQDFKPNWGGWMLDPVAQGAIMAGRRLPDSVTKAMGKPDLADQAAWWQRYYNWSNDVRAAKFGLTLTGNELQAFERATPKPSDKPELIAQGLKTQLDILRAKQQNRTAGLVAGGYNPEQVRETAGHERTLGAPDEENAIRILDEASRRGMRASVDVPSSKRRSTRNRHRPRSSDCR